MGRVVATVGCGAIVSATLLLTAPIAGATSPAGAERIGFATSTPEKSTSFAGYLATPTTVARVVATFTVPKITCTSATSGVGPGAFLAGSAATAYSGGGVQAVCKGGKATYEAAAIVNAVETKIFGVAAGDRVSVSATETTSATSVVVDDLTSHTAKTTDGGGAAITEALIGDNGIDVGTTLAAVPRFTANVFSATRVGGVALGRVKPAPTEMERATKTTVQLLPSAITSSTTFKVTFKHT